MGIVNKNMISCHLLLMRPFCLSCPCYLLVQVILDSGHRVHAETHGDQTSLTIEVTEREDTGNYKIVLQNEAGEATASVKIKVVGKGVEHPSNKISNKQFLSCFLNE